MKGINIGPVILMIACRFPAPPYGLPRIRADFPDGPRCDQLASIRRRYCTTVALARLSKARRASKTSRKQTERIATTICGAGILGSGVSREPVTFDRRSSASETVRPGRSSQKLQFACGLGRIAPDSAVGCHLVASATSIQAASYGTMRNEGED